MYVVSVSIKRLFMRLGLEKPGLCNQAIRRTTFFTKLHPNAVYNFGFFPRMPCQIFKTSIVF